MTKLFDLKQSLMADPDVREEYAKVDAEYAQIEAMIAARDAAKQTPEDAPSSTSGLHSI